jgi:hypothetical protein
MGERVPFQVYIDRRMSRRLRKAAQRRGTSQADLARRFIERGLDADTPVEEDPALGIIGIGRGTTPDLAARHDEYLVRAYRELHHHKRK